MLLMMMRPAGRVIDGTFLGRGQWKSIATSKTVTGFFVGTVFLRGGGKGRGGDTNTNLVGGTGRKYGQYGGNGGSAEFEGQAMSSLTVTIGVWSSNGADTTASGATGTYNGGTPGNGGTTTAVYNGLTRTANGGASFGTPAQITIDSFGNAVGWTSHDPVIKAVTNPGGSNYGRGGGYTSVGGTSQLAVSGVVQIKLED